MKKKIILSMFLVVILVTFTFITNVNATSITDFYTPIDQTTNKPTHTPVIYNVDDTNFDSIIGHIFQKGDKIVFTPILRESSVATTPDTQFEGFMITDGNGGPNMTSTLVTVNKASSVFNTIAQEITFTSEEPIILHSVGAGQLETINNVAYLAYSVRYAKYDQYYSIEYLNEAGATLQYGGPQIDKAYVTDDFYIIKFYDTYVKEGYHFNGIDVNSRNGQFFESVWLDSNTSPSSNGVTTLKTRIYKSYTDGHISQKKMIVNISMKSGYTLKLDANGGKIDYINSKIFEIENKYSDINISDYNTPVRDGYTFGGWYIDSACTKPALATTDFRDEMDASRIEEDAMNMTYYAKWIPVINKTYTITKANTENGTIAVDKTTATKNETVTITATPNAKYKVKSVKVNNSETGITASGTNYAFTMPEANVTVTAEFELINTETSTKKTINKKEENLTVSATGTFTGNPVLKIEETESGNSGYNSLITLVEEDKVVLGSYDISIAGGSYTGELELTFNVGKQYDGDKITVYHKLASGEIETKTATVKDGKITITVNELSPFMLVISKEDTEKKDNITDKEVIKQEGKSQKDETPKTGMTSHIGIATLITCLLIVLKVEMIRRKKIN